ncbi:MAG TPA: SRPBCC domain-containing protein [Actinomycetota bacterium]|nr:SRPBCC domain-containing protein [Actinomycetota bacterium]
MAVVHADILAPPARVFDTLTDAWRFDEWVAGAKDVRDVDDEWPAVGAAFHHTVGVGPLSLDDHTAIRVLEPPRRLVLEAKARPAGVVRVEFDLVARDGGTHLRMDERALAGPARWMVPKPVFDALVSVRNRETLRRLKRLVEREHSTA